MVGGAPRLRLSSQRALRESAFFALDPAEQRSVRSRRLFGKMKEKLEAERATPAGARKAAEQVAGIFGKLDAPKKTAPEALVATTLAFFSPENVGSQSSWRRGSPTRAGSHRAFATRECPLADTPRTRHIIRTGQASRCSSTNREFTGRPLRR